VERIVPASTKDTTNLISALYLNAQDFTRLAFGNDLEWAATDLAISRKPLRPDAGVEHDFEALAAKGALDGFGDFHVAITSLCDFRRGRVCSRLRRLA
jgi:hypothetical protein